MTLNINAKNRNTIAPLSHFTNFVVVVYFFFSTWPLNPLGPLFSWGLGASSLNECGSGSPLLHVCWGPHIRWCMLSVWWSSVWEISGVQTNWDFWSSYRIALLLSFFQPSLIQQQGSAASVPWLGANICIWLFQLLVEFSWVHSC